MYLFPAIDVLDGQAVRLAQGDYERVTVYNDDVFEQARIWADAGARWIHIVDLNGARDGRMSNADTIARIASELPVRVQVGGGIRTFDVMDYLLSSGVSRVVLGTKLATDTEFVKQAVATYGADKLVAGVDARDGMVAIEGWRQGTPTPADELVSQLRDLGLRHLVYTDISRDGMQVGIDAQMYQVLSQLAGFPVIVSGGVSTLADLKAARALGDNVVEGVISGRALYEGALDINEAIAALQGDLQC